MTALWLYSVGDKRQGPVEIEVLRRLTIEGKVGLGTLFWREGMSQWERMADIPELSALRSSVPPQLPQRLPEIDAKGIFQAPWRRFFARMIDMWLLAMLVGLAFGYFGFRVSPAIATWLQQPGNEFLLGWFMVPVMLFVEALVFATVGTTLGKAVLGVKVTTFAGNRPTLLEYLNRQIGVYWYGLGTGFPFVSLFTMARQRHHVAAGRPADYDNCHFSVKAGKLGLVRIASAVLVVFALLVLNVVLAQIAEAVMRDLPSTQAGRAGRPAPVRTDAASISAAIESRAETVGPFPVAGGGASATATHSWTNLVTGKTVQLPSGWDLKERDKGIDMFEGPPPGLVHVFITNKETDQQSRLEDVAEAWQASLPHPEMFLPGETSTGPGGQAVWWAFGSNSTVQHAIFYAQRDNHTWQISVFFLKEEDVELVKALRLKDALLSTL